MKQNLSIFSLAVFMTACTGNRNTDAAVQANMEAYKDSLRLAADTAGLAEFKTQKAQDELTAAEENRTTRFIAVPVTGSAKTFTQAGKGTATSRERSVNESNSLSSESSNTAMRKKGWSKAAKGAVIGGGSGAVIGAVVNKKNRAAGAVIGGAVGAGAGYGVGRSLDKKDGRY